MKAVHAGVFGPAWAQQMRAALPDCEAQQMRAALPDWLTQA